jgi:DNA invertase Pin-like site-specific DNA recombinase
MKLIGYLRCNSSENDEGQEFNISLEDQKEKINAFCHQHNHDLIDVVEEEGSDMLRDKDRPKIKLVIEAAVSSNAEGIVVTDRSRLFGRGDSFRTYENFPDIDLIDIN